MEKLLKVIGILAATKEKKVKITARSAIIATGGYSGNKELLKKYSHSYNEDMPVTGIAHNTGDGLLMATEIGAATEGLGVSLVHGHVYLGHGIINSIIRNPSMILVNKIGERFTDETIGSRATECVNVIARQPGQCVFTIFDEKLKQSIMASGNFRGRLRPTGKLVQISPANLEKNLQEEADKGGLKISNSWDEIAR